MKKLRFKKLPFIIAPILLVLISSYSFVAVRKPLPPPSVKISAPATSTQPTEIPWPDVAQSAVGIKGLGVVAQSDKIEQPRSIASIAKAITALAVMNKKPITSTADTIITLSAEDEALYRRYVAIGGSTIAVSAGTQLSQYHAIEAMMLPSANNMADSLAIWAFGSIEAYNTYANEMVKGYGMNKTTVGGPSGFDDNVLSTASDVVLLGEKLLENTFLARIVSTKSEMIPGIGLTSNTNQLLGGTYTGIKTGHTTDAGYCLLLSKTISAGGKEAMLISAVLGAPNSAASFTTSSGLAEAAQPHFLDRPVVAKDTVVGTYKEAWGAASEVIASNTLTSIGWDNSPGQSVSKITSPRGPQSDNTVVGTLSIKDYDGAEKSVGLKIKNQVMPPSVWWRLTHYF